MKVSVQYADSHLTELLPPSAGEQATEGDATGRSSAALNRYPSRPVTQKRGLFGAGKGEIWMADDWDSPETNEEIARLFNDGPICPGEP